MNGMYLVNCVEFIESVLSENRKCIVVRITDVYDENDGYYIEANKLVDFMRFNGYRGGIVIEDDRDTFVIINMDKREMISLSKEWVSAIIDDYDLNVLRFDEFVRLHEKKYGGFRNNVVIRDKYGNVIRVITLDI